MPKQASRDGESVGTVMLAIFSLLASPFLVVGLLFFIIFVVPSLGFAFVFREAMFGIPPPKWFTGRFLNGR